MKGFTVIEDSTRQGLTPREALLLGDIKRLAQSKGYCWAKNAELAERAGCSVSTIAHTLSKLVIKGYITIENSTSFMRRIKLAVNEALQGTVQDSAYYHAENCILPCKKLQGTMQDSAHIGIQGRVQERIQGRGDIESDTPQSLTSDDLDDVFAESVQLRKQGEQVRLELQALGVKVPNEVAWWARDWAWCLTGARDLHISNDEMVQALHNYIELLKAKKANPDGFWWTYTLPVASLFKKGNGSRAPPITRFLPDVFNLDDFKKSTRAQQGGVNTTVYDMKAIAQKQGD